MECVYCDPEGTVNSAYTIMIHECGFKEPICKICEEHIMAECDNEECLICPSNMSLADALAMASALNIQVTHE